MAMQITINLNIKWSGDNVIVTPVPPIEEPTDPITPPPSDEVIDITDLWYNTFSNGSGELILESGKTYTLNTVQRQKINGKVRIKTTGVKPAYIWIGKETYLMYVDQGEDSVLFELDNGAEVLIENIYPSMREQRRDVQTMYKINWFSSVQNPDARWTAIVKDCDTSYLGKNGGFGMGVLYGGAQENHIAFINYKHVGSDLMQLKNPWVGGVLYLTLQNVSTDYINPYEWSRRAHLTTGLISSQDNVLTLTGDTETTALYNHFFLTDKTANRSFLAHIGRFTFMIDTVDAEIDRKNIQLRSAPKAGEKVYVKGGRFFFKDREAHVLDSFQVGGKTYTIKEKNKTENDEWTNNFGQGNSHQTVKSPQNFVNRNVELTDGEYLLESYTSSFDQYGIDQPVYLVYKDDFGFRTKVGTEFGYWEVLNARGGAHMAYNHRQISIWAENVDLNSGMAEGNKDPYYRESTLGKGKSLGYNIVNSQGFDDEFSKDKVITTDRPMAERIANLIK